MSRDAHAVEAQDDVAGDHLGLVGRAVAFDVVDVDAHVVRQVVLAADGGVEFVEIHAEQPPGQFAAVGAPARAARARWPRAAGRRACMPAECRRRAAARTAARNSRSRCAPRRPGTPLFCRRRGTPACCARRVRPHGGDARLGPADLQAEPHAFAPLDVQHHRHQVPQPLHRNREADVLRVAADGRVDADQFGVDVQQRPARVAGV